MKEQKKKREYVKVLKDGTKDFKIKSFVSVPYANSGLGYPLLRTCLECKHFDFFVRGREWGSVEYTCPRCGFTANMDVTLVLTVVSSCTTEDSAKQMKIFDFLCRISLTTHYPFAIMYLWELPQQQTKN